MKIELKVLRNRLPQISSEIHDAVSRALEESAIAIEQDVKGGPHAAPYRTGNLRRSYIHRRESDLTYVVENMANIAPYAIYVEFGTRRMAPRPHLGPAAEAERPKLAERVKQALRGLR